MSECFLTYFLYLSCSLFIFSDTSQCPKTILSFKYIHVYTDSCVIFIKTKTSWQDARNFCKSLGGDLITIKDARKQQFIMQYLAVNHWETNEVWIGLTDQVKEGDWRWIDGLYVVKYTKVYTHFRGPRGLISAK